MRSRSPLSETLGRGRGCGQSFRPSPPHRGPTEATAVRGRADRAPRRAPDRRPDRQDGGASGPDDMDKRPSARAFLGNSIRPRSRRGDRAPRRCRTNRIEVSFTLDTEAVGHPDAGPNELGGRRERTRRRARTNSTPGSNELGPAPNEPNGRRERTRRPAPKRTGRRARTNSNPAPNEPNGPVVLIGWASPTIHNVFIPKEIRRWAVPTRRNPQEAPSEPNGRCRTNSAVGPNELDAAPERTQRPAPNEPSGRGAAPKP